MALIRLQTPFWDLLMAQEVRLLSHAHSGRPAGRSRANKGAAAVLQRTDSNPLAADEGADLSGRMRGGTPDDVVAEAFARSDSQPSKPLQTLGGEELTRRCLHLHHQTLDGDSDTAGLGRYDADNDGKLTKDECIEMISGLGLSVTRQYLEGVWSVRCTPHLQTCCCTCCCNTQQHTASVQQVNGSGGAPLVELSCL